MTVARNLLTAAAGASTGPVTYQAAVLADSPDMYVRLDTATPFDASPHGQTITAFTGTPAFTTDAILGTVLTGGTCAWWSTATLSQTGYTLEGVALLNSTVSYYGLVGAWATRGAMISSFTTSGTVVPVVASLSRPTSTVGTTNFHHICLTWDGSNVRMWVNGTNTATVASTAAPGDSTYDTPPTDRITIGTYQNDRSSFRWPGKIHSVSSYPVALSGARIAAHYATLGI